VPEFGRKPAPPGWHRTQVGRWWRRFAHRNRPSPRRSCRQPVSGNVAYLLRSSPRIARTVYGVGAGRARRRLTPSRVLPHLDCERDGDTGNEASATAGCPSPRRSRASNPRPAPASSAPASGHVQRRSRHPSVPHQGSQRFKQSLAMRRSTRTGSARAPAVRTVQSAATSRSSRHRSTIAGRSMSLQRGR
jgi:hypothetical protein